MKLSVHELLNQIEAYLSALNTLQYRFGAGLSPELALGGLEARFPELFKVEAFRDVGELPSSGLPSAKEGGRRPILEFLADRIEEAIAGEARANLATLESSPRVLLDTERLSIAEAAKRIKHEEHRSRREALERALGAFLWDEQETYARRIDGAGATARALGYPTYLALREAVGGWRYESLANECEALLATTEDAYRDHLAYVLKRLEPNLNLRPLPQGEARAHDLERARTAPWLTGHFRREQLLDAVNRCLSDIGLPPHAEGRILLDSEERSGKRAEAFVAALKVPNDVRLVLRPAAGLTAFTALLHQFGLAQQWANASGSVTVEDRWLREGSVLEGMALLFDHFLVDPGWHRRYLRLPESSARDAARLAAFNQLASIRAGSAQAMFELSLFTRGTVRPLAEEYQERQAAALHVGAHRGMYLFSVLPHLGTAQRLRAHALEAGLHGLLQERFNEDYWRNPATGRWMKDLFARPSSDVKALVRAEGRDPPLTDAGARLVAMLNR